MGICVSVCVGGKLERVSWSILVKISASQRYLKMCTDGLYDAKIMN